jgi:Tfp pilus assembly pilus retraction ATPase PilT
MRDNTDISKKDFFYLDPLILSRLKLPHNLLNSIFPIDGLIIVIGEDAASSKELATGILRQRMELSISDLYISTFEKKITHTYSSVISPSSSIWQSEIGDGKDFNTYSEGVKNALKSSADIIHTDECEDKETLMANIDAAMSGFCVYTEITAQSISEGLSKLAKSLTKEEKKWTMSNLISALKLIIYVKKNSSENPSELIEVSEFLKMNKELRIDISEIGFEKSSEIFHRLKFYTEKIAK